MTSPATAVSSLTTKASSFLVTLKNAALSRLVGLLEPLLADVEDYASKVAEAKLQQLMHYLASLPVGSELVVLAEGWAVKVVGNGLPQHGAGASLLSALEEALGIPSVIQPPATPEQIAAQSHPSQAGNAPVPQTPIPATPTVPAILQEPATPAPKESIVGKVEDVLKSLIPAAVGALEGKPAVPAAPATVE